MVGTSEPELLLTMSFSESGTPHDFLRLSGGHYVCKLDLTRLTASDGPHLFDIRITTSGNQGTCAKQSNSKCAACYSMLLKHITPIAMNYGHGNIVSKPFDWVASVKQVS